MRSFINVVINRCVFAVVGQDRMVSRIERLRTDHSTRPIYAHRAHGAMATEAAAAGRLTTGSKSSGTFLSKLLGMADGWRPQPALCGASRFPTRG